MTDDVYTLCIDPTGYAPEITIDKHRFNQLAQAKRSLNAALSIERLYDTLILAYIEWEKCLLDIARQKGTHLKTSFIEQIDHSNHALRHLVQLLSLSKQYEDQTKKYAKILAGKETQNAVSSLFENENKEYAYFRLVRHFLRDYLQHESLAPDALRFNLVYNNENQEQYIQTIADPLLNIIRTNNTSAGRHDSKREQVIAETPATISIKIVIHTYIQCARRIQTRIRPLISDFINRERAFLEKSIQEYATLNNGQTWGLYAYHIKHCEVVEKCAILLEWDDVRIALQKRDESRDKLIDGYTSTTTHIPTTNSQSE
jgi:hypothetical protein